MKIGMQSLSATRVLFEGEEEEAKGVAPHSVRIYLAECDEFWVCTTSKSNGEF